MNNLTAWKMQEYLSLHQAACLALDGDPDKVSYLDFEAEKELPMYSRVFCSLEDDLSTLTYRKHMITVMTLQDMPVRVKGGDELQLLLKQLEGIFSGNTEPPIKKRKQPKVNFDHPALSRDQPREFSPGSYLIKQSAIKQWLREKGIHSDYFHGEVGGGTNKEEASKKSSKVPPKATDLLKFLPKSCSTPKELFLEAVNDFIKNTGRLPSKDDLWAGKIKSHYKTREAFNKMYKRYTKGDVKKTISGQVGQLADK